MEIKASLRYYRAAPRKMRLVADLIRKKRVDSAIVILNFLPKKAAQPILKLLESAIANAKNNFGVKDEEINNFYIKKITIDEGPKLKRFRPVARGSAHEIQKKTSHVNLILDEKEELEKNKDNSIKGKTDKNKIKDKNKKELTKKKK